MGSTSSSCLHEGPGVPCPNNKNIFLRQYVDILYKSDCTIQKSLAISYSHVLILLYYYYFSVSLAVRARIRDRLKSQRVYHVVMAEAKSASRTSRDHLHEHELKRIKYSIPAATKRTILRTQTRPSYVNGTCISDMEIQWCIASSILQNTTPSPHSLRWLWI